MKIVYPFADLAAGIIYRERTADVYLVSCIEWLPATFYPQIEVYGLRTNYHTSLGKHIQVRSPAAPQQGGSD